LEDGRTGEAAWRSDIAVSASLFYCHFILMYPDGKHFVVAVLPDAAEIVY
jgi:hypothetical protein